MFNLTREERQVIIFLLSVGLLGAGINFLVKKYAPARGMILLNPDIAKINLNKADKDLLMSVSGIGEKIAQRIIEYRKQQGVFATVEELRKIKGINTSRFAKIKDAFVLK